MCQYSFVCLTPIFSTYSVAVDSLYSTLAQRGSKACSGSHYYRLNTHTHTHRYKYTCVLIGSLSFSSPWSLQNIGL